MATYDLTTIPPPELKTGDILNCPYSGAGLSVILPKGTYKLECWGAQGGSFNSNQAGGGAGGYATGILNLSDDTILYLYTGGQGSHGTTTTATVTTGGGFNGGGNAAYRGGAGGGGTDIRIGTDSLYARVIVAGGGGGAYAYSTSYKAVGGIGGGTVGKMGGYYSMNYSLWAGSGGLATTGGSGGAGSSSNYQGKAGTFGQGGDSGDKYTLSSYYSNGAGGGGWYGGGSAGNYSGNSRTRACGGGGGSGYVYTSSTASNYPSGCLLNSSYYLTDAQTIAGNTSFTSPTGTAETGHSGNGYIRITVIEANAGNTLVKTSSLVPSTYTQLDSISFTGTQYIDTGIKAGTNIGFDATFEMLNGQTSSPYYNLFGTRGNDSSGGTSENANMFRIDTIPVSTGGTEFKWGTTVYDSGITGSQKVNIKLLNKVYTKPDGTTTTLSGTITSNYNIFIGCLNKEGSTYGNFASLKVYNFKLYNGTTLQRNFIPVKRNSDSVIGLYDTVNSKFYTNSGTGTFTAGSETSPWKNYKNVFVKTPAVLPSGYTQLEYIQSSGTQYIDTGLTCNKTDDYIYTIDCELTNYENFGGANGYLQFKSNIAGGSRATIEIKYQNKVETISVNGTVNSTTDWTSTYDGTDVKIGILKLGDANNTWYSTITPQSGKVYSVKIKKAGTLVRDFYPCKNSSGTIGLYDTVNSKFYTNAGTGTFTAGPTANPWKQAKSLWTKTDSTTWKQVF